MKVVAALAAGPLVLLCGALGCDDRFEFDVPVAGRGGGGAAAGGAAAGASGSASTGGRDATGGEATSAGAATGGKPDPQSGCGDLLECPVALHCVDGECRECGADGDCLAAERPRCDLTRHRCVECIDAADCGAGATCDRLANRCLRSCSASVKCPASAHGCDEARGVCYECDEDRECTSSDLGPLCAADGSGCVTCKKDEQCPGKLCDPLTGQCVECRDGADCSSGLCDPRSSTCVAL